MDRRQFHGQRTATVTFFVVVMAAQLNCSSSSWSPLTFDQYDVDALVGSPFTLTCSLKPGNNKRLSSANLDIVLEYRWVDDYIPINKDFIRIVDATSIQLHYTHLPAEFVEKLKYITCLGKGKKIEPVSMTLYVRDRHQEQPNVTLLRVDNWEELRIGWETEQETPHRQYPMKYKIWYRNDSLTAAFVKFENCDNNWCTLAAPFNRTYPGETLIVKVNGSVTTEHSKGVLETVTSNEVRVNLTEHVRPRKIDHINVIQNQSTKTLVFKPPKTNRDIRYHINVSCSKPAFNKSKNITRLVRDSNDAIHPGINSQLLPVTESLDGLPSYSNCSVSVRAISVRGGSWSEWTHHDFQTLQDVPLAAPGSCKGCFQVKETGIDSMFHVIVYFTPLTLEEARGRVELYRIKMIRNGTLTSVTELNSDLLYSYSFLINNLSIKSDYEISIEAKTQSGYNETLNLSSSKILVPQSKHRPTSLAHRFTVIVLAETTVKATCKVKDRSGTDKMLLFWCKGRVGNDRPCNSVLKWKEFPIASTENEIYIVYVINLDKDESIHDFIFGTGIERNGMSSGITWNSCTYDIRSRPPTPRIESHNSTSSGISISLMETSCQSVKAERGFVIGYRLFFCPVESSDSVVDYRCLETMRIMEFDGQHEILNLNDLRTRQTYLVLVQSLSETKTSQNVTLKVATVADYDSFVSTMITLVVSVAGASIFTLLIVRLKQMSFWRNVKGFRHVPIIVPPAIIQTKLPPQLMDDVGYSNPLLGTVEKTAESTTPVDSASSVTLSLSLSQVSDLFVSSPKITLAQRSDSGIEVMTPSPPPVESILPPLVEVAPSGGLHKQAFLCDQRVFIENRRNWDGSSGWTMRNPNCPVISVHPFSTINDHSLTASDVVSDGSGDSRPQRFDGSGPQSLDGSGPQSLDGSGPQCLYGSGYACCKQEAVLTILPVPDGQAQPVTFNSSTSYSDFSDTDEDSSRSSISTDGAVVYHVTSFSCCKSEIVPIRSEELARNEGFQTESTESTGNDDRSNQARILQPFSDYSSVTFDRSL